MAETIYETIKDSDGVECFIKRGNLVRCKDCKHGSIYMTEDVCGKTLIECNHPTLGDNIAIHAWDWFCADGEVREC